MPVLIQEHRPGTWRRICDICGRWKLAPVQFLVRGVDGTWICDDHPGMRTRQELDRINAGRVPRNDLPVAAPKPREGRDTYEADEARIFDLMLTTAPYFAIDQTVSGGQVASPGIDLQGAAMACDYLYGIIAENRRPAHWIASAKTKLAELADFMITCQTSGPFINGSADTDFLWGAMPTGTPVTSTTRRLDMSAQSGIAFLRAYQVFGSSKYLQCARAAAWFCRSLQCGGYLASDFSASDAAGASRKQFGMFTSFVRDPGGGYLFTHQYSPNELWALSFFQIYKTVVGDETIGSTDTSGLFSSSRAATVSACIAEAKAFWTTAQWSADDGTTIQGFSASTPRESFSPYTTSSIASNRGSWLYHNSLQLATGTQITAKNWAVGIRAFHDVDGASSYVTGLFDWLMSFESNSDWEPSATISDRELWDGIKGTYDPTLTLAFTLKVREGSPLAACKKNGADLVSNLSFYDWRCLGLMAPLYASRQAARFKESKRILGELQPTNKGPFPRRFLSIGRLGQSGLSFQPFTPIANISGLIRREVVQNAALVGLLYREEPKAFMGRVS